MSDGGAGNAGANDGGSGTPPAGGAPPAGQQPPAGAGNPAGQGGNGQGQGSVFDLASLPEAAQAAYKAALAKATADAEAKVRTITKDTAAKAARDELLATITKALGGDSGAPADPAKLADEITSLKAGARERDIELGIFRQAATHGANPLALADSRQFMRDAGKLDPDAADFGTKLGELVTEYLKNNPSAKAAGAPVPPPVANAPGGGFGGGNGQTPPGDSVEDMHRLLYPKRT